MQIHEDFANVNKLNHIFVKLKKIHYDIVALCAG